MQDTSQATIAVPTTDRHPGLEPADTAAAGVQRTLRHAISCVGVGRHSGARVGLTLQPAAPGTGVRFRRSDRPGASSIRSGPEHLVVAEHAFVLADADGTRIVGIEYVLAALAMTGIDNAVIEVGGPELPAMDGSAQPFVFLIECAGAVDQEAARSRCALPPAIDLRRGDAMARMAPSTAPHLATEVCLDGHAGPVRHAVALQREALRHELAAARRPLATTELEAAQARGLMRGVSLDNTLIFQETRPMNPGGLRFPDEAARHANLLALAGLMLLGGLPPVELLTRHADHALLSRLVRQGATVRADAAATSPAQAAGLAGLGQRASSPA